MRYLKLAADAIGALLFLSLFLVFLVQIGARFVLHAPTPWSDELAVILYLWIILWAAAFMVPPQQHVVFDLLWNLAGPSARRWMATAAHLLVGALAAVGLPATWDYVHFMAREGSPVLNVPMMVVYLPFALLMLALVLRSARSLWQLARGAATELQS